MSPSNDDRLEHDLLDPEFLDPAARDRVTVTGADAATYLQSQLSQEIRDLDVGGRRWTFALDPTGKVENLARIERTGDDTFVLDTDAGFGEGLLARLDRFKIRVAADLSLEPAERAEPSVDHEAARIAAGWPRMGAEIEPGSTIPATTGVVPLAVDFRKGCYPGQELVERMDSRGADAPRSLRIVDVAIGSGPGDPVVDTTGSEVGALTSVAGTIGLGYVKRGSDVGRLPAHLAG
jgi:folate-binding protein YgfZ